MVTWHVLRSCEKSGHAPFHRLFFPLPKNCVWLENPVSFRCEHITGFIWGLICWTLIVLWLLICFLLMLDQRAPQPMKGGTWVPILQQNGNKKWKIHHLVRWFSQRTKPPFTLWWTNILPWKDPPFLMGNSTISMAIFNSYMLVHQRVADFPASRFEDTRVGVSAEETAVSAVSRDDRRGTDFRKSDWSMGWLAQ